MQGQKQIILFTGYYPYGEGESFISDEIEIASNWAEITVIPVQYILGQKQSGKHTLPDNVEVKILFSKKFNILGKIQYSIRALCRFAFWTEARRMLKIRYLFLPRMMELISFSARGERIVDALQKLYGNLLRNEPESLVFYSYWMVDTAYAIAILKRKFGCKAFTRAHGGDLYAERRSNLQYLPMRNFILNEMNRCFPISQNGSEYLKQKYGYGDKIACIHLGSNDYGESSLEDTATCYRIVTCSYMTPIKRVPLIAEALSCLKSYNIEWVHFGDGEDRSIVEEITHDFPDNIHVKLMGNTKHMDIMTYYRENGVNIFVNASSTEGVPVSIMEALSFGIPALATDVGGTSELVIDGVSGFLLNRDCSVYELAEKIESILTMSKSHYLSLRKSSRQYWSDHFNIVTNQRKFYDQLLQ